MSSNANLNSCSQCLQNTRCFKGLKESEIKLLDEHKVELRYSKGEYICKQGSFASHIIILSQGLTKLYIENPHTKKNLILKLVKPCDSIGLSSLFTDKFFQYSVVALTDCKVCSFDINMLTDIIQRNNIFAADIIRQANDYIVDLHKRFFSISHKQLHGRLADIILYLSKDIFESNTFNMSLSRKDIAEYMGTTTESAIRILKEFHNDKIIDVKGKEVDILSLPLLEKLSEIG